MNNVNQWNAREHWWALDCQVNVTKRSLGTIVVNIKDLPLSQASMNMIPTVMLFCNPCKVNPPWKYEKKRDRQVKLRAV